MPPVTTEVLIERHRALAEDISELKSDVKKIVLLVSGNRDVGLAEQVRTNKRDISRIKRPFVVIAGAVLVSAGKTIWDIIASLLSNQ